MVDQININDICRFCLCVSPQKMQILTAEILQAFTAYFSLQIHIVDSLPNQICDDCDSKITVLCDFRKTVIENEKILHDNLTKGCDELNKYFISFQREKIKEETDICDLNGYSNDHNDNEPVNSEEDNVKEENTSEIDGLSNEIKAKDDLNGPIESQSTEKSTLNTVNVRNIVPSFNFKCLTCFESFETQNLLLSHYKTVHCEKLKENESKATFEVETISGRLIYKCGACSKVYDNKKSMNRHITRGHTDARPFLCKMCGRTYKTASEIVRHGRAHNGTKLFCSHQCGYSTVYHGALKEHERRHNTLEFKYKCEKCDKGFHVKTWYLQHQNVHTGLKPFICDICGVAFHMDKYLTTHRSLKHPQSSNLKRYVCVHCALPCDSRNALKEHLKEHGVTTEKKYLCDLCGKILTNAEQLKFHKRMHLGVKPYACSTCCKSFAKKFNLQLHERTHSGEKAHECTRCGKRYGQRSTLLRHISRHHSDSDKLKPSKCLKTFSAPDQMSSHQKLCT